MDFYDDDERTRAESPGVILRRLADHQRELCQAFDTAADRIDGLPPGEQLVIFRLLDALCDEWESAVHDTGQQVKEMRALADVFQPRKDRT
jgi:hypothetical protein